MYFRVNLKMKKPTFWLFHFQVHSKVHARQCSYLIRLYCREGFGIFLINIPHPVKHSTSQTSHRVNIRHPEHPTAKTSHIPNIPHPKHPTSRTSHISNIPRPEHLTSRTSHIPNIPNPQHPTSPISHHIPNVSTTSVSHMLNMPLS